MLGHLVEYARSHGLTAEPGFAPKTVRWGLVHDPTGRFLAVIPQGDTDQKKNPGRQFPRCPELSQPEIKRGGAGCRHFLVDAADVVALFTDGPPDAKLQAKHAYFVRLLRESSGAHPDLAPLAGIAASLEDPATLEEIGGSLRQHKAKPTDKVTFAILDEAGSSFPVEGDSWHDWWRRFRRGLGEDKTPAGGTPEAAASVRCLASGELVEPAPTHPKIAGLAGVGGLAMGDVLASFKQEAFCSYGLEQAANAAVSEEMAAAYRAALNHLLREHGQKLANSMVTHWFKERVAPQDNPLPWLMTPPEDQGRSAQLRARELLEAIRTGGKFDLGRNRYYVLTLSGASGRVMVRDWVEGPFEELVASVEAWFGDLAIVRRDGAGLAPSPKFFAILGALVRDLKDVPAPLEATLWRTAVHREPIPYQVMAQALAFFRADILKNETFNHARVGLLRAFHVRQGDTTMQPALNEEHSNQAYHCGRLMAVLATLQQSALGDVGAGVVQRYFAAASATPALVLGRLVRTAQFHLNKIDSKGLAHWHEGRIASICSRIGQTVPRTLSLEDQTAFALGYYHQIAADRQKPAAAANETVSSDQETDAHV
jgi:CRISPR-associated protein Csd1